MNANVEVNEAPAERGPTEALGLGRPILTEVAAPFIERGLPSLRWRPRRFSFAKATENLAGPYKKFVKVKGLRD